MLIELTQAKEKVGSSNANMIATLHTLGFETIERENATLDEAQKYLQDGYILIVNYMNMLHGSGHYSVAHEIDDTHIHLRDSSLGIIVIKRKHFEKIWHDMSGTASQWFVATKPKYD